jgi:hypothetical protein
MSFTNIPSFPIPSSGLANEIYKFPDNSFWFFDSTQWLPLQAPLVSPMSYGATGNGIVDDTDALEECIDFCRGNNHILFIDRTYRTTRSLKMHNIKVFSNNGKILCLENNLGDYIVKVQGTVEVNNMNLIIGVKSGTQVVKCVKVSEIKKGDLIKISSNKLFAPLSGEDVRQGEIQKVDDVVEYNIEGIDYYDIKIFGAFEDSYERFEDNAIVTKVIPCFFEVNGILTIEGNVNDLNSKGLLLDKVDGTNLNIKVVNTSSIGVQLLDCYKPNLHVDICGNDGDGVTMPTNGYGLSIGSCTMYGLYSGNSFGAKHAFTTSGIGSNSVTSRGVSWGNRITDFTGSNSLQNGIFDSHASTGSVYFSNCTAIGYMKKNSVDIFTPLPNGFSVEAAFTSIENCIVQNCSNAVYCNKSREINTLIIRSLTVRNTKTGIRTNGQSTPTVDGCVIQNLICSDISIINDFDFEGGAIIDIGISTIVNWEFSSLYGVGVSSAFRIGLFCSIPGLIANDIKIKLFNPQFYDDSTKATNNPFIRLGSNIDFIRLSNCTSNAPQLLFTTVGSGLNIPEITLIDFISEYATNYHISIRDNVNDLVLIRCVFKDLLFGSGSSITGSSVFCQTSSNVLKITIKDCVFEGENNKGVNVPYNKSVEPFKTYQLVDIDNNCNNLNNKLVFLDQEPFRPTLWVTKGSFNNQERIIGLGTPIGNVPAPIGCVYINLENPSNINLDRYYFKMPDDPSNPTPFNGWKVVSLI